MTFLSSANFKSPLGNLNMIASEQGLLTLSFENKNSPFLQSLIKKRYPNFVVQKKPNEILDITHNWLKNYFKGYFSTLTLPPFDLSGTSFTLKAWKALLKIPAGKLKTYGELAKIVGSPKASRAIGLALNQNPIGLIIPCHRVIGSNGKLTGFRSGLYHKQWLLAHEGHIEFQ